MAETDITQAVVSDMTGRVDDFSVDTQLTDAAGDQKETTWVNTKWSQYLGYYKEIPELKKAIDALAIWILGKGYIAEDDIKDQLDNITGWGEDTFNSIMWNMLVTKKVAGDSYAEIIRNPETGAVINLMPLDPGSIRHVVNRQGKIIRYEQISKAKAPVRKLSPNKIFHLCNDRIADEIHGVSAVEACEKVILARNEAIEDWKKVLHRNVVPVRIIEADTDDTTKLAKLKTQYEDAINKGEVLIVPKGNVAISDTAPVLQDALATIKYYENFFYQAVGIPKIILGGSEEFTEASSKIGYLTFEQIYAREQLEVENDLWNQVAIKIKYNKPASLMNEMLSSEGKNTGQTGFQPNDVVAGRGENAM